MWGEEEEDFKEDLRGLPLGRMIGSEGPLGIGSPVVSGGCCDFVGGRGISRNGVCGNGTGS